MKILFVTEHFYPRPGGGEVWSLDLCKALVARGHDVTVITSNYGQLTGVQNVDGITVHRVGESERSLQRAKFIRTLEKHLEKHIEAHEVDIIHSTTYVASLAAERVAKAHDIPSVVSLHSFNGSTWLRKPSVGNILNFVLEQGILRVLKPRLLTVPSEHTRIRIARLVDPKRIRVVENFIDIDELTRIGAQANCTQIFGTTRTEQSGPLILYAGSLNPLKDVDRAVAAMKKSPKQFHMHIIGNGTHEKKIRRITNGDSRFTFEPNIPHTILIEKISCADVILNPSLNETYSYLVAEGLALGKLVVSRNVGIAYNRTDISNLKTFRSISEIPKHVLHEYSDIKAPKPPTMQSKESFVIAIEAAYEDSLES